MGGVIPSGTMIPPSAVRNRMLVGVHATPNIVAMDSHIKESDAPLSTGPSELRRTFPSESRNSTGAKMSFDPEGEGGQ